MTGAVLGRPRPPSPRQVRGEAGSAAIFSIALLGVLLVVAMSCAGIAGIVVAHRRAQGAADLGSLAGATAIQRGRAPCPAVLDSARRNGARLVICRVSGEIVRVQVEAATAPILGLVRRTRAWARAGPVYSGDLTVVPR